jgi:hypothetical protein
VVRTKAKLQQLTGLALVLSGCATHQPAISSASSVLNRTNAFHIQFGIAALARDSKPATYSFQKARGKRGSAKEGFSDAVELAVSGPAACVIIPGAIIGEIIKSEEFKSADCEGTLLFGAAAAGIAGGATAVGIAVVSPAMATHGLIQSWRKISPAELGAREAALSKAMSEAAAQEEFHSFLLKAAGEKSPRRLVAIGADDQSEKLPDAVDAVLEARVEELRLERCGSDEGSYFLRIKVRTQLVRRADGTLLYEQPVEYTSGRSLFLDWTLHGAVEGVAETGYRALAQYIVDRIL